MSATSVIRPTPSASETHGPHARRHSLWTEFTPWFMTIASVLVLVCLAWFLLDNIYWFRGSAVESKAWGDNTYRIYIYQLLLSMIKRSVGLFAGFALIFIGTSVAFYTLKHDIALDGAAGGMSAKLNTASPGIVAMVLGVGLIMFTIQSKDSMTYTEKQSSGANTTQGNLDQKTNAGSPGQNAAGANSSRRESLVPEARPQ